MRHKELIIASASFFGLLLMALFLSHYPFRAVVDVKFDSTVKGTFQLFWADRASRIYSETDSKKIYIQKGENQISIPVGNLDSIHKFRFDPLNKHGRVGFNYFRISQPGFKTIFMEEEDLFRRLIQKNEMVRTAYEDNGFVIISAVKDPQLELEIVPEFNPVRFTIDCIRLLFSVDVLMPGIVLTIALCLPFKLACIIRRRFLLTLGSIENHQDANIRNRDSAAKIFKLTFIFVVIFRFIFITTYPLSIAGDGHIYYGMLYHWNSSLVLAGGYPFFFGIVKQVFDTATFIEPYSVYSKYLLLYAQHATDVGVMVFVYLVLERIFGTTVAAITALLYGLNPLILGPVSSTRPEWFQSSLFQLSLVLAYVGYSLNHPNRKLVVYIGAGLVFILGFFVKFNLLPFAVALLFILFMDTSRFRFKLIVLTSTLICGFFFYLFYVYTYHKPSTGTRALTHDKSWILMYNARAFSSNSKLNVDNGIHTKRYKVLTWFLSKEKRPSKIVPAFLYQRINAIPDRWRKPYRDKYDYLFSADHEELDAIINKHPQIKGYIGDQMMISYFMGLKKSDDLGTRVFLETVIAEPFLYARKVMKGVLGSFSINREAIFPMNRNLGWQDKELPWIFDPNEQTKNKLELGFSEVKLEKSRGIRYQPPVLWMPGVHLFSLVSRLIYSWWLPVLWLSAVVVVAVCLYTRFKSKRWVESSFVPILLFSITIVMIFWSNAIHMFRQEKELIFILPYMCIFGGLMCGGGIKYIKKRRFR